METAAVIATALASIFAALYYLSTSEDDTGEGGSGGSAPTQSGERKELS